MAYVASTPRIGIVDLSLVTSTLGTPGISQLPSVTLEPQLGEIATGWDPALGGGEFMYVKAAGAITAGNIVELAFAVASGYLTITATPWTGTANTGKPLAVAVSTMTTNQFGWVQVQGAAITTTAGSPVSGNAVYYSATGTAQPTAVAGKQALNAVYASAPSVTVGTGSSAVTLSATQALVFLDRPFAQGAIT